MYILYYNNWAIIIMGISCEAANEKMCKMMYFIKCDFIKCDFIKMYFIKPNSSHTLYLLEYDAHFWSVQS